MKQALFSRRNLDFTLWEVHQVQQLLAYPFFEIHDQSTLAMVLDMATSIADKIQAFYQPADKQEPTCIDQQVAVHEGVHVFFKAMAESGLLAAPFALEWEGQQMPKSVFAAVDFILGCANNSFVMFSDLVQGCANLILAFGTDTQKQTFVPPLLAGKWAGTMCLTEPQAGSSLAEITTTAFPQSDGTYRIKGQKIFISAGDHDLTENIIHLVLARIADAPQGVKGISLFIVPKHKWDNPTQTNDVKTIGLYHKMGQKATPALHLSFGEDDQCEGFLLGKAHEGLLQMFQMMNAARLGVGLGGTQLASAAYYTSLQYAQERRQGRRPNESAPTPIVNHPDVKKMLLDQKVITEGVLSLLLQCYLYLDLAKVSLEQQAYYEALLQLLTPVVKTVGAEMGNQAVHQGLQVLGGYGYTNDFPLEQMARDVRIMSIYEGTTGIQAQTLLGRQIGGSQGKILTLWEKEVQQTLTNMPENLSSFTTNFNTEVLRFKEITARLLQRATTQGTEAFLADATLYLHYFGMLNVAWQWLKMGSTAQQALASDTPDNAFYQDKIHSLRFFFKYHFPACHHWAISLQNDELLTLP